VQAHPRVDLVLRRLEARELALQARVLRLERVVLLGIRGRLVGLERRPDPEMGRLDSQDLDTAQGLLDRVGADALGPSTGASDKYPARSSALGSPRV
jgi:hypothetical protein